MKKIIGLAIAALLIVGIVGGGTFAYFNDTETAADNTFSAGTLDLKVGASDVTVTPFSISAKKPGDVGTAATWALENTGTLDGTLAIGISAITNNENTRYDMETDAGDTTSGAAQGELGGLLKIAFWHDINSDGNFDNGEKYLKSDATVVTWAGGDNTTFNIANVAAAYATVDSYGGDSFASVATMTASTAMGNFLVLYNFPNAAGNSDNVAQSDGVQFTITWTITQ